MGRYGFFAACLSVVTGLAGSASAEEARVWRVGACHVGLDHTPPHLPTLRAKLAELGYVEGRTLRFDFRNLADDVAAAEVARAFVADKVDVMVAFENQCAQAMHRATTSIPIIFSSVPDPVALGLVKSLARPETNLTGVAVFVIDPAKPIQLLKEINPAMARLLVVVGPPNTVPPGALTKIRETARALGIEVVERAGATPQELTEAFQSAPLQPGDGVVAASETNNLGALTAELALRYRLALAANRREIVAAGALFSYGADVAAQGGDIAIYVDKAIKGAKPESLPVEQPTNFRFLINLKTARAIGLSVPDGVLARADELIE
jgi:putative tryptophan/tyrosine transport system substrate-binding protein